MGVPPWRAVLPPALAVLLIGACTSFQHVRRDPPRAADATITSADIERVPQQSVEEIIASRVPGVKVSLGPTGHMRVRIRGTTTLYYSEPLYVLDGFAVHPGPTGISSVVARHDIDSIEVLMDPADTAFYGVRGAHGVIVIRTKEALP